MHIRANPFQQLYFSDDNTSASNFVALFSAHVLQTAVDPVFQTGNVVLSGTQGCGKTMILNLLRPDIRLAYFRANKLAEFPVRIRGRQFISAGINLTRSRITDLVHVTLDKDPDYDLRTLPLYFGDFFNYLVVADLLHSLEIMVENPEAFLSAPIKSDALWAFTRSVATQDCWFGALDDVQSFEELKLALTNRIIFYRKWVNGNHPEERPFDRIRRTKTSIGEPIARTADCLRETNLIGVDVPVLIRVDQIEELHRANPGRQRNLLLGFRKILNKAFGARDARVHYRAGSRRYGWNNPEYLAMAGSEAQLENRRDYLLIDMDRELFALEENRNSIFEKFALDAFQKRVTYYMQSDQIAHEVPQNLAKSVFGKSPTASARIVRRGDTVASATINRALALDSDVDPPPWSEEWRSFLTEQYQTSSEGMLNAVLAAAWGRQTGGGKKKIIHRSAAPPREEQPWITRKWWRKERLDQAVLQLSTRLQQRMTWWGFDDIRSLSGGNITVFLHICHRIFDGFLKSQSGLAESEQTQIFDAGQIDPAIQASGILFASNEWFRKLPEEPDGNSRQRFIEQLGIFLNTAMTGDARMAYPGGNGISLNTEELHSSQQPVPQLRKFLEEAVGYGALYSTEHSSKHKKSGRRTKFYLNPILCPRFQLPESRTKEPYYWTIEQLIECARRAHLPIPPTKKPDDMQPDLPLLLITGPLK